MKSKKGLTLSIIGSTGSIGRQALTVLEHLGGWPVALAAGENAAEMELQCRRYKPRLAALANVDAAGDLRDRLSDTSIQVIGGDDAICEAATHPEADTTLIASAGVAGLKPLLAVIKIGGRRIALANKETIVYAGNLVMERARATNTLLIPVDSELTAIHQCCHTTSNHDIKHISLTASGGPFFGRSAESLKDVTVEEALKHPTWKMGKKITIESALLLNKGYEIFETMHYFNIPADSISVLIHRESIVHAVVQFSCGATFFQTSVPDMSLPIQYALTYPDKYHSMIKPLDLTEKPIIFAKPDLGAFPCLKLSFEAAKKGGLAGAVLASAGEAAVERFMAGTLSFNGVAECIEVALKHTPRGDSLSIEDIMETDAEMRAFVYDY